MPEPNLLDLPIRHLYRRAPKALAEALVQRYGADTIRNLIREPAKNWRGFGVGEKSLLTLASLLEPHGLFFGMTDIPAQVLIPGPEGCSKCGRFTDLHRHHIRMRCDGGGDEEENTDWLCGPCHGEWHSVESITGLIEYHDWLACPTLPVFLLYWRRPWPENLTAAEMQRKIESEFQLMKAAWPVPEE